MSVLVYRHTLRTDDILVRTDPSAIYDVSLKGYSALRPDIKGFTSNPIYINAHNVYNLYQER